MVLSRVESRDAECAFDIFDALNTTGEPLTALETCKPLVILFEENLEGYQCSVSQEHWGDIETSLFEKSPDPSKRQTEIKQSLTNFGLYWEGEKLPADPTSQRHYIRASFRRAEAASAEVGRAFTKGLKDILEFRAQYWESTGIDSLGISRLGPTASDQLRLCLRFIADAKTQLSIPILTTYWVEFGEDGESHEFVVAAQALAAFLALRRSVTGGTARIDEDFRRVMREMAVVEGRPPTVARGAERALAVEALKEEFRASLADDRIGVRDKQSWLERAREMDFGTRSPAFSRFILLASAHNADRDPESAGRATRHNVIPRAELEFLSHSRWVDSKYATVEHIAPQTEPKSGWEGKIYSRQNTRHLIGNLVLLPEKENQGLGNAPRPKKKLFYQALSSKAVGEREAFMSEAKEEGYSFGRKTEEVLKGQEYLGLLEPIAAVEEWTEEVIRDRTDNVLGLAWDVLEPWLWD